MSGPRGDTGAGRHLGFMTFGCKVNQYESAFMAETAARAGFTIVAPGAAELLVVNSCSVTARTDRQVRQFLRQAGRWAAPPEIAVTGCYAQRAPEELAGFPRVRAVFGNAEKASWVEVAAGLQDCSQAVMQVGEISGCTRFADMPVTDFWGHTRAFVKIQDGCDHRCSYCIVPSVRGPERSLPAPEVCRQVELLSARGFREVVLTGINLSRYGRDLPGQEDLGTLIGRLQRGLGPVRVRLSSLEPQDLSRELLRELARWPQFCHHFHIPMQSGAAAVLTAMHRTYHPREFEGLIQEIRAIFPEAAIGLDVLVGFPTETEEDFAQTLELLQRLPVSYFHVFPYSPRPGTPAAALPPASSTTEIQTRAHRVRSLGLQKKAAFCQSFVGRLVEVLVEGEVAGRPGWMTGLTGNYLRVRVPGGRELANQVIPVRLHKVEGQVLIGAVGT